MDDAGNNLVQTTDGGFVAVGYARSSDQTLTENKGKADYWIVKVDSLGELEWQSSFGGNENDIASDAVQTPDGGYLIVGGAVSFDGDVVGSHGSEDAWVLKLNATGGLEWSKTYGGSSNERIEAIEPTSDGNYVLAGYSDSFDGDIDFNHGDFDYWLLKIDGNGNLLWENTFGGSLADWAFDVKEAPDGGFMIAGSTISTNGDVSNNNGFYDYWIVKTDTGGNLVWENNYGGTLEERAYSISIANDGGAIVAGTSNSADWDVQGSNGSYDFWLAKISGTGDLEWAKCYGGPAIDRAFSVVALADDHFLAAGFTTSNGGQVSNNHGSFDAWITKFDETGNLLWERNFGGTSGDRFYGIIEKMDGGYAATGLSSSGNNDLPDNFGGRDLWIACLSPDTLKVDLGNDTTLCFSQGVVLQPDIENVDYLWSDGSTQPFLAVTMQDEYWVEVDDDGCKARDSIVVSYLSEGAVELGNDTILCDGENLLLTLDVPGATYEWRDGSVNDSFLVEIPGTYWVTVTKDGCEQKDTVEVEFTTIEIDFDDMAFICQGEELPLSLQHPQATYLWQDGSTLPDYVIDGPGEYWVRVTVGGCTNADTVLVDFQAGPDSIFAATSYLCEGEGIWFDVSYPGATYLWQDGSTEPRLKAVEEGVYSVEVTINNCVFEEETVLASCESCMYIPNVFSPNGDGINDEFRTFPVCSMSNFQQQVYDRWGNLVFENNSISEPWDGFYNGKKAMPGTYIYLIKYDLDNNGKMLPQQRVGSVTVVR